MNEELNLQEEAAAVIEDVATDNAVNDVVPQEQFREDDEIAAAANDDDAAEKSERKERVRKEVTQEMLDKTSKDLMKMLDFLGHDDSTVKSSADNKYDIMLDIVSEDAGRIIGRKGQSLESLQLLLNRMAQKDDPEHPRIFISIDGYSSRKPDSRGHKGFDQDDRRSRRGGDRDRGDRGGRKGGRRFERNEEGGDNAHDESLRQQALDAAKEVRMFGDPKTLPSMNAHDRRIIHITLENEADIVTESEGEGVKKNIVISLKK